mgnify:CR=1 FL=1
MKLFQLGNTQIRLHPGLLLVLVGATILGLLWRLLQAMSALVLHEISHGIIAASMGYRVDNVEFLPFGGVARLNGRPISPKAEFCIAAAGPLCSLVVAGAVSLAIMFLPILGDRLDYFLNFNIALALFNLLPLLPLDGGRMFRAFLLCFMKPYFATAVASWLGIIFGAGITLFSLYLLLFLSILNPFLLLMGVFLLAAAIRELRAAPQAKLSSMLRRKDAFVHGEALQIRNAAVRANMPCGLALSQLSAAKYNLLFVLDEQMKVIGQLDEVELLEGIARNGHEAPVASLLKKRAVC